MSLASAVVWCAVVALSGAVGRVAADETCVNASTGLPCYCVAPPANMTYILVSTGGAGSLTMTAFLERYSPDVYHLHDPFPPVDLTEPTISMNPQSTWDRDQRVRIMTNTGPIMGRRRGLIFSNTTFPAHGERLEAAMVVFLYRDPVKTIVSHGTQDICRRVRHHENKSHSALRICAKLRGDNETKVHAAYAHEGVDIFQLRRYFHHYAKPSVAHNYRVVNVKFEALWSDFDRIAAALCLPPGTTYEKETSHVSQSKRIDDTSLQQLTEMYASLSDEIQQTPNVLVVDPGVRWKGSTGNNKVIRPPSADYVYPGGAEAAPCAC